MYMASRKTPPRESRGRTRPQGSAAVLIETEICVLRALAKMRGRARPDSRAPSIRRGDAWSPRQEAADWGVADMVDAPLVRGSVHSEALLTAADYVRAVRRLLRAECRRTGGVDRSGTDWRLIAVAFDRMAPSALVRHLGPWLHYWERSQPRPSVVGSKWNEPVGDVWAVFVAQRAGRRVPHPFGLHNAGRGGWASHRRLAACGRISRAVVVRDAAPYPMQEDPRRAYWPSWAAKPGAETSTSALVRLSRLSPAAQRACLGSIMAARAARLGAPREEWQLAAPHISRHEIVSAIRHLAEAWPSAPDRNLLRALGIEARYWLTSSQMVGGLRARLRWASESTDRVSEVADDLRYGRSGPAAYGPDESDDARIVQSLVGWRDAGMFRRPSPSPGRRRKAEAWVASALDPETEAKAVGNALTLIVRAETAYAPPTRVSQSSGPRKAGTDGARWQHIALPPEDTGCKEYTRPVLLTEPPSARFRKLDLDELPPLPPWHDAGRPSGRRTVRRLRFLEVET